MKTFFKLLFFIVVSVIALIFFMIYGYDSDYGFYERSTPWMKDRLETYSYLSKRFDISINSTKVGKENGRYYIEFKTRLKSKSNFRYDDLSVTPCLYVYLKSNNDDFDFYSVDLKNFSLLAYNQTLEPNKEISISKKMYFDDLGHDNFNSDYLIFNVSNVTLNLSLSGKAISNDGVNTNFPILEEDITNQYKKISN